MLKILSVPTLFVTLFIEQKAKTMILIGGQALKQLGSDRHTDDFDYLIKDSNQELFVTGEGVDYINAAKHDLFKEIWDAEEGNEIARPQSLAELKAFSFVQHCFNMNFRKADACEYDLKFLNREYGVKPSRVQNYVTPGEWQEIKNIFK